MSPEERERGITIATSHVEYESANRHYAHVDCPGHADYVKNMITGAAQNGRCYPGLWSNRWPNATNKRGTSCCQGQVGVPYIVVFLNKADILADDCGGLGYRRI